MGRGLLCRPGLPLHKIIVLTADLVNTQFPQAQRKVGIHKSAGTLGQLRSSELKRLTILEPPAEAEILMSAFSYPFCQHLSMRQNPNCQTNAKTALC